MSHQPMSHQPSWSLGSTLNLTPATSAPLLDISRENAQLEPEILAAITHVTRSGGFVLGPEVKLLEQRVAQLCDVPHGIGCASGSDALLLSLMAADVGPGDEVILPSFTFFATASAVTRLGGTPVFVDIDHDSFNISPDAIAAAVTSKTKAILPVHLFGLPADMAAIQQIATAHGLAVIEDAAQAIGAAIDDQPVGAWGDVGCFSFYPTKNLGGFGDGGMLVSRSESFAAKLSLLRVHGMEPRYYHSVVGINSRLDTVQAAVLNVKLPHLTAWTQARRRHAERYTAMFHATGLDEFLTPPSHAANFRHVWNQYTVRVPGYRDTLRQYLREKNVGSEIYYPVPLHQQACFAHLPQRFALPETERAASEVLSLPVFPMMTVHEQDYVVKCVAEFAANLSSTQKDAA